MYINSRKTIGQLFTLLYLTGCCVFSVTAKDFELIRNRQSSAVFRISETMPKELIKTVEFFNSELQKSAGTMLPVLKENPASGNRIEFVIEKYEFMERGKYSIEFPDDRTMRITGSIVSVRWALNYILEKAGIHYPYPGADGAYYPQLTNLSIPLQKMQYDPSYKLYRGLFAEDLNWQLSLNCDGGDSTKFFNHGMDSIFPLEKYGKGEWVEKILPLRNGQRDTAAKKFSWEPCYSNPATAEEAINNICEYFAKHPDQNVYSLTINDGFNSICECDSCLKANNGQYIMNIQNRKCYSEVYYKWVNKVVDGVTQKYPDKYFGLLAYTGVINPPSFKLHSKVSVVLCFEPYACIDAEAEKQWKTLIEKWKEKASNIGIWDYGYGIAYFTLPRVYFHQQASFFKYFNQQGGNIGFVEGIPSFGEGPKRYLYLKLFNDVNIDVDKTLNDWYNACVGKDAAPYLKKYFDFWEKFWCERAIKTDWFKSSKMATYTVLVPDGGYMYALEKGDISDCRKLMEKVVELAKKHGDKGQQIRAEELTLEFEFYEASAYLCAAGIIPLEGSLNTKKQALELAQAIPEISRYAIRRAEIAAKILKIKSWGGIYKFYPEMFKNRFCKAEMPEVFSKLSPYMNDPEVQEAVSKSLADKNIPQEWKKFIDMMLDMSSGKTKNVLSDGSFEKSTDGWIVCGKISDEQASAGKQSVKVTFAREGSFEMVKRVPMQANKKHYLSAKIYIPADYPPGQVYGKCYILGMNDKNVGSNYYIPVKTEIIPGKWTTVTTIANPGPCAGYGDIYLYIDGMKKGENAYVDDVLFCEIEK